MNLATVLKLLHVLLAFWFVTGLLARDITLAQASRLNDIQAVHQMVQLAGRFERLMVRPGSFAVFLFGLVTAWAQGVPVLGSLQGGTVNWLLISVVVYVSMGPILPLVFIPRGKVFEQALSEATAQGQVTPAVRTAFADTAVARARTYELIATSIIVILMVTKPF